MRVRRQLVQKNISKRAYEKGNCFETQCMKLNTNIVMRKDKLPTQIPRNMYQPKSFDLKYVHDKQTI